MPLLHSFFFSVICYKVKIVPLFTRPHLNPHCFYSKRDSTKEDNQDYHREILTGQERGKEGPEGEEEMLGKEKARGFRGISE
jgi:hypothetical protein